MNAVSLPIVCAWCERVRTGAGRWEEAGAEPVAESRHARDLPRLPGRADARGGRWRRLAYR